MPFVQFKEFKLNYEYQKNGNRPVLIFVNSLGTNLHLWEAQVKLLAPYYSILRFDKRGHGCSTASSGEYSIEGLADDVIQLMDHLKIEKADFVGISIGGMIGQALAIHNPTRFGKFMLVCTSSCQTAARQIWDDRIRSVKEQGLDFIAKNTPDRWFTKSFQISQPKVVKNIIAMVSETQKEGYLGCCYAIRDMDLRPLHKQIINPVLIVAGTGDVATPPEHGKEILNNVPHAKWEEIDGPHLINVENEKAFNSCLCRFLEINVS